MYIYCPKCGTAQAPGSSSCIKCGAIIPVAQPTRPPTEQPAPPPFYSPQPPPQPGMPPFDPAFKRAPLGFPHRRGSSGMAVTSLVLGICSFILFMGPVASIPGVILGKMARNAIQRGEAPVEGEGVAKIGFYLNLVNLILSGVLLLALLTFCAAILNAY